MDTTELERMQQTVEDIVESYRAQSHELQRTKETNERLLNTLRTVDMLLQSTKNIVEPASSVLGAVTIIRNYVAKQLLDNDPNEIPF